VDVCGLLGRGADPGVLAVKEWIQIALMALGMATGTFIVIDKWVHGRRAVETKLQLELKELKKLVEDGRSIWDRSVELGQGVQALRTMVIEVKDVLDRASVRDERQQDRFGKVKEQLARIEEHLKATDRSVDALTANVEALRTWVGKRT